MKAETATSPTETVVETGRYVGQNVARVEDGRLLQGHERGPPGVGVRLPRIDLRPASVGTLGPDQVARGPHHLPVLAAGPPQQITIQPDGTGTGLQAPVAAGEGIRILPPVIGLAGYANTITVNPNVINNPWRVRDGTRVQTPSTLTQPNTTARPGANRAANTVPEFPAPAIPSATP